MEAVEVLIELDGNGIDAALVVDGVVTERADLSGRERGGALTAWLEKQATGSVHARLHVSGSSEMRLALEVASSLALAGHTVSVGNICRFRPSKPAAHGDQHALPGDRPDR